MKKNVVKSSLAYHQIRDGIISGKYPPNSRLVLADLQRDLNLGQGAIRDAILQLDKSGLVTNTPYKGATVNPMPSLEEFECLYKAKKELEIHLACSAMEKLTPVNRSFLQKIVDASTTENDAVKNFYWHDRKFHATLYDYAKLPHVVDVLNNLQDHLSIFLNTYNYSNEYIEKSVITHKQMLIALGEHNSSSLTSALNANIDLGIEYIKTFFKNKITTYF